MRTELPSAASRAVGPKAQTKQGTAQLPALLICLHPLPKEDPQRELLAFIHCGLCRPSSKKLQFAADPEWNRGSVNLQKHVGTLSD